MDEVSLLIFFGAINLTLIIGSFYLFDKILTHKGKMTKGGGK